MAQWAREKPQRWGETTRYTRYTAQMQTIPIPLFHFTINYNKNHSLSLGFKPDFRKQNEAVIMQMWWEKE